MKLKLLLGVTIAAWLMIVCAHAAMPRPLGMRSLQQASENGTLEEQYAPVIAAIEEFLLTTPAPNATTVRPNFWAARVLRLAWHTSATWDPSTGLGGSNGSTMRFEPEISFHDNKGLEGPRGFLEDIKQQFPWITYADLWTLAGCAAVNSMGGPAIMWRPGRQDFDDGSRAPANNLPDAKQGADHIRDIFGRLNFTDQEAVALIGAHSVGGCHEEFSGFSGFWTLAQQNFTNAFYVNLLTETYARKNLTGTFQWETPGRTRRQTLMMLPTDMALKDDEAFHEWVSAYAKNETLFFEHFASAFAKVIELGVTFPDDVEPFPVIVPHRKVENA